MKEPVRSWRVSVTVETPVALDPGSEAVPVKGVETRMAE